LFAVGLHTCTAVARSLCVSCAFLLVHAGTRMILDSFVAVPAASSMWTVQLCRDISYAPMVNVLDSVI